MVHAAILTPVIILFRIQFITAILWYELSYHIFANIVRYEEHTILYIILYYINAEHSR